MGESVAGALAAERPVDAAGVEAQARRLRDALTPEEKVGCLSGDPSIAESVRLLRRKNTPLVAGAVPRLGIPGIRFTDGPRGVVLNRSTAFPVSMARGASFDPDLEERIGDSCGAEARAQGANLFAGVCINLLRHPAWGRAQETYGEDPHLLGEMGAAFVRGAQRHVMACLKHYACNSMENSRFWVDVRIAEADLRDLYLPHFRRCVEEGVAAVMSAYNKVNGVWCGSHRHLLTEILKDEWGFEGFVMSDFFLGVRGSGRAALEAGQDLEMPSAWRFRRLPSLLRRGRLDAARIDDAALRLLRQQVRFAQRGEPGRYTPQAVAGAAHRALAREAARAGIVLLRNSGDVLPLEAASIRRLAVVGWLASVPNTGDLGSSAVSAPEVITLLGGLLAAGERHGVTIRTDDGRDPARAARTAAVCDAAVIVVGNTWRDEGEWLGTVGGDRSRLRLRKAADVRLVEAVAAANPRTVVVLMGGGAFVTEGWRERVAAMVMVWYPGMEGGHAVAEVLFDEAPPGGRLPCTWPRSAGDLPPFRRLARRVTYGPLYGYRLAEASGRPPAFPFGFGLGYSRMKLGTPRVVDVGTDGDRHLVRLELDVTNLGGREGVEVVQAYVPEALGTEPRALRTLRAFVKTTLPPGATTTIELTVPLSAGASTVWVGTSSALTDLVAIPLPPGFERQTPAVR